MRWCKIQTTKSSQKKLPNMTNSQLHIERPYSDNFVVANFCKLYEHCFYVSFLRDWYKRAKKVWNQNTVALQIRTGQWSITANLWPLTAHVYDVMIIVTVTFPRNLFLLFLEEAAGRCSSKEVLKCHNIQRETCVSLFLIKLQA